MIAGDDCREFGEYFLVFVFVFITGLLVLFFIKIFKFFLFLIKIFY